MTAVVHHGDALQVLRTLPTASVHCAITSPPYFGLRDYGVAGQIGLEPSLRVWVDVLVEVFAEVRRVLRPDGTLWLNCGDAYVGTPGSAGRQGEHGELVGRRGGYARQAAAVAAHGRREHGLEPKQRMFLPHRLAIALQDDGWFARDEIVWAKRTPMPESARDRCTMAHEFFHVFSPGPDYFYDQEAIREPVTGDAHPRRSDLRVPRGWDTSDGAHQDKVGRYRPSLGRGPAFRLTPKGETMDDVLVDMVTTRIKRSVWTLSSEPYKGDHFATFPTALVEPAILAGTSEHGCCAQCGAPWDRIVQKGAPDLAHQIRCGSDAAGEYHGKATKDFGAARAEDASAVKARILAGMRERTTTGWQPTCSCYGKWSKVRVQEPNKKRATIVRVWHAPEVLPPLVPATVLDPFCGTGTTGVVAVRHGRSFVGVELNLKTVRDARRRITAEAPLFVRAR